MTALIVFAHGSSIEAANDAVRLVAADVSSRGGYERVEAAFLDGGRPTLPEAAEQLIAAGATRVVVLPYFLTLGLHLQRDLPRIVDEVRRKHPGVGIEVAPPLDGHPALAAILLDRAAEALEQEKKR